MYKIVNYIIVVLISRGKVCLNLKWKSYVHVQTGLAGIKPSMSFQCQCTVLTTDRATKVGAMPQHRKGISSIPLYSRLRHVYPVQIICTTTSQLVFILRIFNLHVYYDFRRHMKIHHTFMHWQTTCLGTC